MMYFGKYNLSNTALMCLLFVLAISGCGKKTSLTSDVLNPKNPMSPQFKDNFDTGLGSLFEGGGNSSGNTRDPFDVGSNGVDDGLGKGLSQTDKRALRSVFDELEDVNPMDGEVDGIDPAIEAQLRQLLRREARANPDEKSQLAVLKIQLGSKMLGQCASQIADYVPRPGEPLIGTWRAPMCQAKKNEYSMKKPFTFNVSAVAQSGFSGSSSSTGTGLDTEFHQGIGVPLGDLGFTVSGLPKQTGIGTLIASPEGGAQVSADRWSGTLTDLPEAGTGKLRYVHPKNKKKNCDASVTLEQPTNQIPEKYMEGVKKAGSCFRKALFLMSPLMEKMFSNMDPQLAGLIQMRMLGVRQGQ